MMSETERRNGAACTNILAKLCDGSARVGRLPQTGDWQIVSALVATELGVDEYRIFKAKDKLPAGHPAAGHAQHYGLLVICWKTKELKVAEEQTKSPTPGCLLSMMQRSSYMQNMLFFTAVEAQLNINLASTLLVRVQDKETKDKVDFAAAGGSMALRERLMEVEDQLYAISLKGHNTAVRPGNAITVWNLDGPVRDSQPELLNALLLCETALKDLLRDVSGTRLLRNTGPGVG